MKLTLMFSALCLLAGNASRAEEPAWITQAIQAPRLQHRTFESAAAKTKVSYHIYTPEVYDTEKESRFPVEYWLHGTGGGLQGLRTLVTYFDAAIRADKIPPMLIVFPNGLETSMWSDSKDGRVPMETVVVKDLIPHIDATFRTIATREGRLIEGFSMGGYGAARLGFKYPDLFAAVSLLGAGPLQPEFIPDDTPRANPAEARALFASVWGGDQEYFKAQSPRALAKQNIEALKTGTRIRQVIGDRDSTLANNRDFEAHLKKLGIPHDYRELKGVGHDPRAVLDALGEDNWEFYRGVFGEKKPSTSEKPPAGR